MHPRRGCGLKSPPEHRCRRGEGRLTHLVAIGGNSPTAITMTKRPRIEHRNLLESYIHDPRQCFQTMMRRRVQSRPARARPHISVFLNFHPLPPISDQA